MMTEEQIWTMLFVLAAYLVVMVSLDASALPEPCRFPN